MSMTATVLGRWEPGSPEWHAARAQGLGGSEIAPILGLSPWESRFGLWHRKQGALPPIDDTPELEWGRRLEPAILAKYRDLHPEQSFDRQGHTYSHPDRPWQIANPDLAGDTLVEAKTARYADGWGDEGTDQVPIYYRIQTIWYMDTLGYPEATIAVLIGGSDYREYTVTYDPTEAAQLRDAATEFLDSLTIGEPPDIDSHSATYQALRNLHPDIADFDVDIDDQLAEQYLLARAASAEAAEFEQHAKNLLAAAMGNARRARWDGHTLATRQSRNGGTPYLVAGRNLPTPTQETTP